jgi:hypothetical protein
MTGDREASTSVEHADAARRLLSAITREHERYEDQLAKLNAIADAAPDDADLPPEWHEANRNLSAHKRMVERWTDLAQIHAMLATVPEPLEAPAEQYSLGGIFPDPRPGLDALTIRGTTSDGLFGVGQRVVWLQERPGRPGLRVLATDTAGTIVDERVLSTDDRENTTQVTRVGETAWVQWDDGLTSEHYVDELRVVLGA